MKRAKIARMPPVENLSKNTLATMNGTEDGILFFFLSPFALVVFIFRSHFQSNWTAYCRNKFCTDSESCLVFLNTLIRNLGCDKIEISVDVIHRDIHYIKRTRLWRALSSCACSNWHFSEIFMYIVEKIYWNRWKFIVQINWHYLCNDLIWRLLNSRYSTIVYSYFEGTWNVVESSSNDWTWTQSTSLQFPTITIRIRHGLLHRAVFFRNSNFEMRHRC